MNIFLQRSISRILKNFETTARIIAYICSLSAIVFSSYLFGYYTGLKGDQSIIGIYRILLFIFAALPPINILLRHFTAAGDIRKTDWMLLTVTVVTLFFEINRYHILFSTPTIPISAKNIILSIVVIFNSIIYLSQAVTRLLTKFINPMAIFTIAFFLIILIGTFMLTFPNCTRADGSIHLIDALFIATSATCVTGLCPVDFVGTFTLYGQLVVLTLIQIGGLGILTITSFFALSIMGAIPYSSTLMLKDLIADSKDSNINTLLTRIITTTIAIEGIGALMIFSSIGTSISDNYLYNIYFAVFHSISAFCNAGFSISQDGLCIPELIEHNSFYYTLSVLVILGGIGFPIYSNLINITKIHLYNLIKSFKKNRVKRYLHKWDLNSIVVIKTTAVLLIASTLFFLTYEWDGMLQGLSIPQKIAQAFYNSALPRTAGFSSQDITQLRPLTFLVILMLMFIGGAPQSTAGGIKVTSFYILVKNAICIVRGMNRLEVDHREISKISVNRAFAGIGLTVTVILLAYTGLLITEPGQEAHKLLFEVVSAIGTVGSSMGVTGELSEMGKIIITITMFIGRIGIVTLLASFVKQRNSQSYRYPQGHIIVN